jgi:hypothetical protein
MRFMDALYMLDIVGSAMGYFLRSLTFALCAPLCFGAASVSFSEEPGKIQVVVAGKPFTTLHFSADLD